MAEDVKAVNLNLGCGFSHIKNCVNVDKFECCKPDLVWDLDTFPYPWENESINEIFMRHVLEHLDDWWMAFSECVRVLRKDGLLMVIVPDESNSLSLTMRDHRSVFNIRSFHGIIGSSSGTSGWAASEKSLLPVELSSYNRVPYKQYNWMLKVPWLLDFCANHMRNFIHEQVFVFKKV